MDQQLPPAPVPGLICDLTSRVAFARAEAPEESLPTLLPLRAPPANRMANFGSKGQENPKDIYPLP